MTDQSLHRADELLTELVEQIETARSMPMSSSCVLPRERLLDLLDELREVLPPEIDEARKIIASRDALLHDAYQEAATVRDKAAGEADAMTENARGRAADIVHDAEVQAYETVERGKAEHATLVSATTIHQSAARAAGEVREQSDAYARGLREQADDYHRSTIAEADRYAADIRAEAERYAARLAADSEDYADRTLYELATTLQRAAHTADQGRVALAQRRAGHPPASAEPDEVYDGADTAEVGAGDGIDADAFEEAPEAAYQAAGSDRDAGADGAGEPGDGARHDDPQGEHAGV